MSAKYDSTPPPWYRQFWPWLLISIPGATVVAGIATIWIASQEPPAMVHDDYYKEGLAINANLARDRAATQLGLQASLSVDSDAGRLTGQLSGDHDSDSLTLLFIHPISSQYDHSIQVQLDADGRFDTALPVQPERWYVELQDDSDIRWRLAGEFNMRQYATVELSARTE